MDENFGAFSCAGESSSSTVAAIVDMVLHC